MPEIRNAQKLNKKRLCGCCNSCRIFPSYGRRNQIPEIIITNNMNEKDYRHFYNIPQPLDAGTVIKVKGIVLPECSRFAVNLCCTKEPTTDIALHLNPRISQRYVVRNTRIKERWGVEEVTSLSKFELIRNQQFQIDIVITETEFLININGKYVCSFAYRLPVIDIKAISIEGPVDSISIEYEKTSVYPVIKKFMAVEEIYEDEDIVNSDQNLSVPLKLSLKDGFQQGWQLEIQGRVKVLPVNFSVNLQDGPQLWPRPNIYLHLNPRFGYANTKHVFVRNAWLEGSWGPEERVECFLFTPGSSFSLAIRKCDSHFSIYVNGQLAGEFTFRGDVNRINTLYIQGDVTISNVVMRHKINDKYFHNSKQSISASKE
ncbi:galectin-8-like [Diorhabda sublineata]|uniref:galectin-8-like n=1 Tax=Diorhabda sublineata TaxID=1163346 RepID=UPI0024E1969B|nr:galectin-8-like [Diorhabda sublineata]